MPPVQTVSWREKAARGSSFRLLQRRRQQSSSAKSSPIFKYITTSADRQYALADNHLEGNNAKTVHQPVLFGASRVATG